MATVKAGAVITGSLGFEEFGAALAGGDFNGDGIADLAVNFRQIGSSRGDSSSTVQVILGGDGVLEGELQAAALAGGQVTTSGVTDIGVGVDVPGPLSFSDVNGDGFADLLIGAPRALSTTALTGGAGYILFGREGTDAFSLGLGDLTNGVDGQGFFSTGGRNAGSSIVDLGDIDGDGENELFVGVPFGQAPGTPSLAGLGYVFERPDDAVTDLAGALSDPPSFDASILSNDERAFLGEDAAALGDVNGDGIADFLVTGRGAVGGGTGPFSRSVGEAYVIYGQQGGLPETINTSQLDESLGTRVFGTDLFSMDARAEAAGDVNGDGLADFLLMDAGPSTDEPLVYVVYGVDGGLGASFDLSTSDGVSKLGGVSSASNANGVDMASVGDLNDDGYDDILVSRAGGGPTGAGETALLFGSAQGFGDTLDLDILPQGAGYRFQAPADQFGIGFAVTGPGDLNGDGINDIAIGGPFFNPPGNADYDFDAPGAVYIVYGGSERLAALDALDGTDGIIALENVSGDIEIDDVAQPVTYTLGDDFTVVERNGEDTTFAVAVTRSSGVGAATIALAASGSAQSGTVDADFTRIGGSNSFADGETEITILYRLTDDLTVEFAEEIVFDLSILSSDEPAEVTDGQQVVTIQDDDEISLFSLGNDFSIAERNGQDTTFAVTVTRTFAEGAAAIALTPSGSATAFTTDADFTRIGGSSTFADGETETTILYRLTDDLTVEFAEEIMFDLSIVSSDAAAEITDGQQVVTIQDDDEISFFSVGNDFSIAERNGQDTTFAVTVARTFAEGEAEIALSTSGTGVTDAFRFLGSNTFADGDTETQVLFRLVDDSEIEPTEELIIDLSIVSSDAAAEVADGRQIVSILDDDTPVTFGIGADLMVFEENGVSTGFTTFVTRSSGVGEAVVNIGLGGTATAFGPDRDYVLVDTSVTFADGETSKAVRVNLVDDAIDEPDETIELGIIVASSTGVAIVDDGTQVITIVDDDAAAPIIGGSQNDRLDGTSADDRISAGGGNDTVFALGGDDFVVGGSGRDALFGGTGNDTLNGGTGNDFLFGGAGNDRLAGQNGDDALRGNDGADTIIGGQGDDSLFGGENNDALSAGDGNDRIEGDSGADRIFGGDGRDTVFGGSGNDDVRGGNDRDVVLGNSGADTLRGEEGNDVLHGGSGNDKVFGGNGNDSQNGGFGDDSLSGGSGSDTLVGGNGNDFLNGGSGVDALNGGAGNDTLNGGFNNDTLFGGDGDDRMSGGSGRDFVRAGAGNDTVSGGSGNDVVSGESGNDFLAGGSGQDIILGGSGRDTIVGGTGDDILTGGGGRDVFVFNAISGDDLIQDFRDGIDRIAITSGATRFADLQITSGGGAAIINFASVEIELERFDFNLLDASDFDFG